MPVLDHPEAEWFENADVIVNGIDFEGLAVGTLALFQCKNATQSAMSIRSPDQSIRMLE